MLPIMFRLRWLILLIFVLAVGAPAAVLAKTPALVVGLPTEPLTLDPRFALDAASDFKPVTEEETRILEETARTLDPIFP